MSILKSNTKYEDLTAIARITSTETQLTDEFNTFHSENLKNFYRAAGYVLKESDLQKLIKEGRPHYQINLFLPILLNIMGDFKTNLPGISIFPEKPDDAKVAEVLERVNTNQMFKVNNSVYEFSKAFLNAVIGRIGFIKQEWNYTKSSQGDLDLRFHEGNLKWDTSSSRRDFKEVSYVSDSGWYSWQDLIKIYAFKNKSLAEEIELKSKEILGDSEISRKMIRTWAENLTGMILEYGGEVKGNDSQNLNYDKLNNWHDGKGRFRAVDFYERRQKKREVMIIPGAVKRYDITDISEEQKRYLFHQFNVQPIIETEYDTEIIQTSVIPGLNIKAYEGKTQLQNNYKFTPILCFDFHPYILETKSYVDMLKDMVESYNLREHTNLAYLMKASYGGLYAEESAIKGREKSILENKLGGLTVVNNNAISGGKIKEKQLPPSNIAIMQHQQHSYDLIKELSAIHDNTMGKRESSGESGKLFNSRVAQSDIMKEMINENAQSAFKVIVENNIELFQKYMTEERVIRLQDEYGKPEWLTINEKTLNGVLNDISVGRFDVNISVKPFGRRAKEEARTRDMDLISALAKINPAYVDPKLVVDISGSHNRDKFIERIEMIDGISEQDQQISMAQKQMELDQAEANKMSTKLQNEKLISEIENTVDLKESSIL